MCSTALSLGAPFLQEGDGDTDIFLSFIYAYSWSLFAGSGPINCAAHTLPTNDLFPQDRIKEKLTSLRSEADMHIERADAAETEVKNLKQDNLRKEQEIASLQHKISLLEADLDKTEGKLADAKKGAEDHESSRSNQDSLQRKISLLESELDTAEKNLRDTTEKLRQTDVKAEHFERQVASAEQERDAWEKKYEEAEAKYRQSKHELEEVVAQMESL
ncbi:tropomyosin-2 [Tilletia horrida]|nr:tropomyosin-2 [Tilletia horrida]